MVVVDVMPDASEIVHYDETQIPLYVRTGRLSTYPGMRANCHWHEDLELICVLEGEMHYFISGKNVALSQGDFLFVNSRQMHYGYGVGGRDCIFSCVLLHPSLLTQNQRLSQRFIRPLLSDTSFSHYLIHRTDPLGPYFEEKSRRILQLKQEGRWGYPLEILSLLSDFILQIARIHHDTGAADTAPADANLLAQQRMVAYIARHYTEEISLEEIAASASVSKSTCCRLFQSYIRQSPFTFLNAYRLEAGRHLLLDTKKSITEIATLCGFNHASYFTRLFTRSYGCSPAAYRAAGKSVEQNPLSFRKH